MSRRPELLILPVQMAKVLAGRRAKPVPLFDFSCCSPSRYRSFAKLPFQKIRILGVRLGQASSGVLRCYSVPLLDPAGLITSGMLSTTALTMCELTHTCLPSRLHDRSQMEVADVEFFPLRDDLAG